MNRNKVLSIAALFLAATMFSAGLVQAQEVKPAPLPLSTVPTFGEYQAQVSAPLTLAQQRARYEADMRMARIESNRAVGFEPLRPVVQSSLSNNEWNHYFFQPVRTRPVWGVWTHGSRIW